MLSLPALAAGDREAICRRGREALASVHLFDTVGPRTRARLDERLAQAQALLAG